MNDYYELGLASCDVLNNGMIIVAFTDSTASQFINNQTLTEDCTQYNSEIIDNLRKYITCYCAEFGSAAIQGKSFVFDLAEPNGNIVRIV